MSESKRTIAFVAGVMISAACALTSAAVAQEDPRGYDPSTGFPDPAKIVADHFVPVDKKLAPKWVAALAAKGARTWYTGKDLETIGMPIGGICAGQVYLLGDGRLGYWAIFNKHKNSGYGKTSYDLRRIPPTPIEQGFAVRVQAGSKSVIRSLNAGGFRAVRFCGEYPIGIVQYRDPAVPIDIDLEAFSPFIPLNADDSALPATVMQFTVTNTGDAAAEVELVGWLENAVCFHSRKSLPGLVRNKAFGARGLYGVLFEAAAAPRPKEKRKPILFEDFEAGDYGKWKVQGKAFGKAPPTGTLAGQQPVTGYSGKRLVNTYLGGDDKLQGKLTSPEFAIQRPFVRFLVAGGDYKGKTCINLVVADKVVRTAMGKRKERLKMHNWDVSDLIGQEARIEIVDAASDPWGHINVDRIEFADQPLKTYSGPIDKQFDYGTMALAALGGASGTSYAPTVPDGRLPNALFEAKGIIDVHHPKRPLGGKLRGAVCRTLSLKGGQKATVAFVVAWHFPNRSPQGNYYARRFASAQAVAEYVAGNFERLIGQTRLWHKTYYDSTLPHWLLDRLNSTTSTLATNTCHWWANGRFWAWEGVGCCHGTCGHVWNYAHTPARLFPRLERSVREMQDFNPSAGFIAESGAIRFRGERWRAWAGDSQGGYVLKAYREHLMSADGGFLKRNWPRIRKALEFLIDQDANDDGLIEGRQHNTYDIDFYGANTMIGSLYLAALRAGQEMAGELGEKKFADRCGGIFDSGRQLSVKKLFNGEYFVQQVDLTKHPKHQYGPGCLADQLFGEGWARQVALGDLYPKQTVPRTLRSIWRYNWAPDIGPQNLAHKPERWFARTGETGLFTCTWPHSPHLPKGVRYKNEIWTGIEYQVAGHMAWEGMVTEALAICRGIHDRYHPSKHNPWNEVECGDHYARGMASWGVLIGLSGFELHGPSGRIGFAPRITPNDFRCAFTAPEGWGTISQKRKGAQQVNRIEVKWGLLKGRTFALEVPKGAKVQNASAMLDGREIEGKVKQDAMRVLFIADEDVVAKAGQAIIVEMTLAR